LGEVTILTNSYGSEYGKGGGSVTNVIYRSGTNNFHGSTWDLIQNTALQAIDASDKAPIGNTIVCQDKSVPQPNGETCKPVSVENTFGFAGGGRIVRDKLFFFGTSQWDRTRSTATDSTLRVPKEAGFQTLSALPSNPRVDALLLGLSTLRAPTATSNIALGNGRPSVEVGNAQPSRIAQLCGFDVGVHKAEHAVPFNSRGTINYNAGGDCGGTACTGLANFIDDFSGSAGVVAKVFGGPIVHPDQNIQGYYAEDAWQARPNFTLTLGVRYEFFGTPENVLPFPTPCG
jgi:outer membrane receptor protein involved in Fe transport